MPMPAFKRLLFLFAGWLCFGLGVVGMFLPLMPTTIFWIIAVWFWSKSNPELMQRVYAHPRFGAGVRDFLEQGTVARRGKWFAVGGMLLGYGLFFWLVSPSWVVAAGVALLLLLVAAWITTRPEKVKDPARGVMGS